MNKQSHFISIIALIATTVSCSSGGSSDNQDSDPSLSESYYQVGGQVTGLNGTLILQNNLGDNLTLTQDGRFYFDTSLVDFSSYSVTINSQPANQRCSITNESGMINGALIHDIEITCEDLGLNFIHKIADGIPQSITHRGTMAYIAAWGGLHIMDFSDPDHPASVAFHITPGFVRDVILQGDYAYLANGINGLRIVNISQPDNPVDAGFIDTPGDAYGIAINGNYAYVADGANGLRIINVSNPAAPTEEGFYDTPGTAYHVAISGNIAYVADNYEGVQIIDVSDATSPTYITTFNTPGNAEHIVVSGNLAYVADGYNGLHIINIANPASPSSVGFLDTSYSYEHIAVSNDYVYATKGFDGMDIIDISNPSNPNRVLQIMTPADKMTGISVDANKAYIAADNGIQALDMSTFNTTGNTSDISSHTFYASTTGYGFKLVFNSDSVLGDNIYMADGPMGVKMFSVNYPAYPYLRAKYTPGGGIMDIAFNNGNLYTAELSSGIRAININYAVTGPSSYNISLTSADVFDTLNWNYSVTTNNNYAYLANSSSGLRIFDISDPANLAEAGSYTNSVFAAEVAVSGNYVYLSDTGFGLRILDVSTNTPVEAGALELTESILSITLSGNYAYISNDVNGLRIVDISDPTLPVEVGIIDTPGEVKDVAINGTYAYIADGPGGLRIYDIQDPANPAEMFASDLPSDAISIAVNGNYIYLSDYGVGLEVFQFIPE